jgi:pimeloyl-ACP methyl ester carboxylesterase
LLVTARAHRLTVSMLVSADGAELAVHDLGGATSAPPVLISHATGFHARCYTPVAHPLAERFHVRGVDHRGHGSSTVPPGWDVDWAQFGDDTVMVAEAIAPDGGLIGVGHSMGGASLLMAAHARPGLFDLLVLFEPIASPPISSDLAEVDMREIPIVQGALRRRATFPTKADALANYAAKPPLSLMVRESLENYVEYGFRDAIVDGEHVVELCCPPWLEAEIFIGGRDNGVWDLLGEIGTRCIVVGGKVEERQPSANTEAIAEQLPNAKYVLQADQTHFGPFSHPAELAALV